MSAPELFETSDQQFAVFLRTKRFPFLGTTNEGKRIVFQFQINEREARQAQEDYLSDVPLPARTLLENSRFLGVQMREARTKIDSERNSVYASRNQRR